MPENPFSSLQDLLLDSGVAPRHVRRMVAELEDHFEDLQTEALRHGLPDVEATAVAMRRIGKLEQIAEPLLTAPELRCWIYRYPRIARLYLPVAYALLLPATPVFSGLANPARAARWGAAMMLSAGITAAMFLSMQLAIVLT